MASNINRLYELAVGGDSRAEADLFAALTDRFRVFAHHKVWNSDDAEDLVQAALTVVAAEYRTIEIKTSFVAWAHTVMKYRLLGYIQKQRREKGRTTFGETAEYLTASWTPKPDLIIQLADCLKMIGKANRRYARILNMHRLGFSRKEVCEKLEMTQQQSWVVMSRARAMLRQCIEHGDIK
ncbi:MAG: RNA polymerase sigma factor [Candidatus Zixiibacteriota bacterium]|nr:MAG: RNA polymerase sigma factor [candidate division Zixibacteria bacterium]